MLMFEGLLELLFRSQILVNPLRYRAYDYKPVIGLLKKKMEVGLEISVIKIKFCRLSIENVGQMHLLFKKTVLTE